MVLCGVSCALRRTSAAAGGPRLGAHPADQAQRRHHQHGRIERVDSATVLFKTSFGEMTVAINKIEEVRTVPAARSGKEVLFPNPNTTRLFFGPTPTC